MTKKIEPCNVNIKIVRHEKSDKTKGANRPTAEGFKAAYERGLALRAENPDARIAGFYSNKARSQICLGAWLAGAGILPIGEYSALSDALNSVPNSPSEIKEARAGGADASYVMDLWLGKYAELVEPCAEAVRDHVVQIFQRIPYVPRITLNVSHTPVVEASLLKLIGEELDSKRLREIIGRPHFAEGTGYDVTCGYDAMLSISKPVVEVIGETYETNIRVEEELDSALENLISM
jgi:hypothetical protein